MNDTSSTASLDGTPPVSLGRTFIHSGLIAAIMGGASMWTYTRLPDAARIPIHWNAQGRIDGFADKSAVFLLPGVILGISFLLFFLPTIEPRRGHLLRSVKAYRWVWLGIVVFLSGLHVLMLAAAMGRSVRMEQCVAAGTGLLFMIVGNFLGKVRSNFVFGFRTPWTLSSELSWNRTHRLAGWLFVVTGAAVGASAWAFSGKLHFVFVLVTGIAVAVIVPTVYSFWVWRTDRKRSSDLDSPPSTT